MPSLKVIPFEFQGEPDILKTQSLQAFGLEEIMMLALFVLFDTIPECDGQTGGHTGWAKKTRPLYILPNI